MLNIFANVVERAKTLRQGATTVEFAAKLGMTQQTVDLYLKGARKPSLEFVYNLCRTFDVSADWLLGLSTTNEEGREKGLNTQIRALKVEADRAATSVNKLLSSISKLQEAVK